MKAIATAVVSLLLSAAPPFMPPKTVPMTDALKCDYSVVIAVDAAVSQLRGNTHAGLVVYKVSLDQQVIGKDGKPAFPISQLTAGTKVRIYYLVEVGAVVQEIDLE